LIDAIDREDQAAVGELIELPVNLQKDDLALFARRYILGSKLYRLLEEKLGQRDAQRAMLLARLDYLPRVDAGQLQWQMHEVRSGPVDQAPKEGAMGSLPDSRRLVVRMVRTERGWKVRLDDGIPALVALNVQDAPWRNRVIQQVTDELKAGTLATVDHVIDGLVPRAPDQAEPVKADRSTPPGAILVAAEAIDKGDAQTLADSFEMMGGDDGGLLRMAEQTVLERKVENAIRARFNPDQAERIVKDGFSRRGPLDMYERNVTGWAVEGDVARGVLKEPRYDVALRMTRRDGIWRIQLPPRSTMPQFDNAEEKLRQAARRRALQEVLDHPERFAKASAVLEALDPSRKEAAEVDVAAAARNRLEEIRQEMAKNPPRTPEEAEERALGLDLWEIGVALASKDAKEAARHYFAEGDDGSYVLARENRLIAAAELASAANREIGGEGRS
jgi:hypothetical protein